MAKKLPKNFNISIGEICNTLKISRATYYRYLGIREYYIPRVIRLLPKDDNRHKTFTRIDKKLVFDADRRCFCGILLVRGKTFCNTDNK